MASSSERNEQATAVTGRRRQSASMNGPVEQRRGLGLLELARIDTISENGESESRPSTLAPLRTANSEEAEARVSDEAHPCR